MTRKQRRARTIGSTGSPDGPASGDLDQDYAYVRADLRRIGMLAGAFLVVLAVLALFLK